MSVMQPLINCKKPHKTSLGPKIELSKCDATLHEFRAPVFILPQWLNLVLCMIGKDAEESHGPRPKDEKPSSAYPLIPMIGRYECVRVFFVGKLSDSVRYGRAGHFPSSTRTLIFRAKMTNSATKICAMACAYGRRNRVLVIRCG